MTCSGLHDVLSDYLDDHLDAESCDELEQHALRCAPCQASVNTLQRTVEIVRDTVLSGVPEPHRSKIRESLRRGYTGGA